MGNETKQGKQSVLLPNWPVRLTLGLAVVAVFFVGIYTDHITHSYWGGLGIGWVVLGIYGFFIGYAPHSDRSLVNWSRILPMLVFIIIPSGDLTRRHAHIPKGTSPLSNPYFFLAVASLALVLIVFSILGTFAFRRRYPDKAIFPPDDEEEPREMTPMDVRTRQWIIAAALATGLIAAFLAYNVMRHS